MADKEDAHVKMYKKAFHEVIMCSDRGFVAFGREEYHMETMKNLTENWRGQLHITEK